MTVACPHDCADGWLRTGTGHAQRCAWCATRRPVPGGPPIALYEDTGRQGIDAARAVLANTRPAQHPGPIDPLAGMTATERSQWLTKRANSRRLGRASDHGHHAA